MWRAIRNKKVDVYLSHQHPEALAAWRRAVEHSEDLLTSGVLERLSYLPGAAAMEIVLRAAEVKGARFVPVPEPILESLPWPHPGDDERIEPDWVWLTDSYLVVFEAKWGRGVVPLPPQLEAQVRVCAARWSGRRLIQVAVVQSGNIDAAADRWQITWANLRGEVVRKLATTTDIPTRRILQDLRDILDARGVASVWFDTLATVTVNGTLTPFTTRISPRALPAIPDFVIDPAAYGGPWT